MKDPSRPHFSNGKHLFLSVSEQCNENCVYCYLPQKSRTLSTVISQKKLRQALEKLKSFGITLVTLVGGEPSILPNFFEVTREVVRQGMDLVVQTNGSLTRKQLDYLSHLPVRLVSVSLDSPEVAVNDQFRFPGSTAQAHECLCQAVDLGISVRISTVVGRHNVKEIPNLLAYAETHGATLLNLHQLDVFHGNNSLARLQLSPVEWIREWRKWAKLARNSKAFFRAPVCYVSKQLASLLDDRNVACPPRMMDTLNLIPDGSIFRCPLLVSSRVFAWNVFNGINLANLPDDSYLIDRKTEQRGACPLLGNLDSMQNSSLVPVCPIVKTTLNLVGGTKNGYWDEVVLQMLE